MSKKIFWISSYPKSGNTWIRSILVSLYFTQDGKFKFELLKKIQTFDNIKYFKYIKKINKFDFDNIYDINIISKYWIDAQKKIDPGGDFLFLKTHHACISLFNNVFTLPSLTRSLIYVVRDPRDVVISSAKFNNTSVEKAIEKITTDAHLYYNDFSNILKNKKKPSVPLLNWSNHFKSWDNLDTPKIILKYEDMIDDVENIIRKVVKFIENNIGIIPTNIDKKISNIIKTTNFNNLKKRERTEGFPESNNNSNFFRSGNKNQWKKTLTIKQINIIEKKFTKEMKLLNYL